mgnify:FL=1|jgi:hypothetical protein
MKNHHSQIELDPVNSTLNCSIVVANRFKHTLHQPFLRYALDILIRLDFDPHLLNLLSQACARADFGGTPVSLAVQV